MLLCLKKQQQVPKIHFLARFSLIYHVLKITSILTPNQFQVSEKQLNIIIFQNHSFHSHIRIEACNYSVQKF